MMRPPSGFGDDDDDGVMDDFDIKTMANLIGRPLTDGRFKYYRKSNRPSHRLTASMNMDGRALTRIIGEDGSWNYAKNNPDEKTRCRQKSCFICRRYTPRTINTQWMCVRCNMPLCQIDRSDRKTRMYSCVVEHSMTHNQILGCGFVACIAFTMPDQLKKYKLTQSERKKKRERIKGRCRKLLPTIVRKGRSASWAGTAQEVWQRWFNHTRSRERRHWQWSGEGW